MAGVRDGGVDVSTIAERCWKIRRQTYSLEEIAKALYGACEVARGAIKMQDAGVKVDWEAVKHTLYMALERADSTDALAAKGDE